MATVPGLVARLGGISKLLDSLLDNKWISYEYQETQELFARHLRIREKLREALPDLYGDLDIRELPPTLGPPHYPPPGRFERKYLEQLRRDVEYLLEVWESRNTADSSTRGPSLLHVFISHGRSTEWREVQAFIEKDLETPTLELAQEPNRGRTVLQKLAEESNRCSYAVIVMTGDDMSGFDPPRARENVIHEIGYFQGRYGMDHVCVLYEEGTNIPTNIQGLAYLPFPKGLVRSSFGELRRELLSAFV
jgi:predicted nucleotide-binding protein